MSATTATPPSPAVGDDFLNRIAAGLHPNVLAPARPLYVTWVCQQEPGRLGSALAETYDRVVLLLALHAHVGRNWFTEAEIARVWPGSRSGRLSQYIRRLLELGILQEVGRVMNPRSPHDPSRWSRKYHIDVNDLTRRSREIIPTLMRRLHVPMPVAATFKPPPGQLALGIIAPQEGQIGQPPPSGGGHSPPAVVVPTDLPPAGGRLAPQEGQIGQLPPSGGGHYPPAVVVPADPDTHGADRTPQEGQIGQPPPSGGGHYPPAVVVPADLPPAGGRLAPQGGSLPPPGGGNMDGSWIERSMDEREDGAHARTHALATVLETFEQRIIAQVEQIVQRITPPPIAPPAQGASPILTDVPPPPAGEEPVARSPLAAWSRFKGSPPHPSEEDAIEELIRAFQPASDHHAPYWFVRAVGVVALNKPHADVSPAYVRTMFRAMAESTDGWSSASLMRNQAERSADRSGGERRTERGRTAVRAAQTPLPVPEDAVPAAATPPPPEGPDPTTPPPPTGPDRILANLSAAQRQHGAVAMYAEWAARDTRYPLKPMTPDMAERIIAEVRNRETWQAALAFWLQSDYRFTNIPALLDRYRSMRKTQPPATRPKQLHPQHDPEMVRRTVFLEDLYCRYPHLKATPDAGMWFVLEALSTNEPLPAAPMDLPALEREMLNRWPIPELEPVEIA